MTESASGTLNSRDNWPKVTLYSVPICPAKGAELMLNYKGIPFKRVDLINGVHGPVLRLLRFSGDTVPAIKVNGKRVQQSRLIARELDRLKPDPPLFPGKAEQRRAIEDVELWADDVLQDIPRKLAIAAFGRDRSTIGDFLVDANLPISVPPRIAAVAARPLVWTTARHHDTSDHKAQEALRQLPGCLDRVDSLIADGVIGSDQPNAADFQIASSVRLLLLFDDLRHGIENRPAGRHALRLAPHVSGRFKEVLPKEWLDMGAAGFEPATSRV